MVLDAHQTGTMKAAALLLWGKADTTIPVELGRRLARALPEAKLVEIDAGHVPNQEQPAEVLARIWEFLDGRHVRSELGGRRIADRGSLLAAIPATP
jgi:hypothetical protein